MSLPRRFWVVSALLTLATPVFGADQWIRLSTPHLEIYTASGDKGASEKKARDAARAFEQTRALLLGALRANWDQIIPVRVISFQSDKQFRPYAPDNGAAYSSNAESRDYFIMIDSDPDHLPGAIHQYADLAVLRSGVKVPLWLGEGLAEMFSATGMAGGAMKDHIEELKSVKWMDLNALMSVNEHSPAYNEKNRAGQFYAESWALAHMLYLGRDYRDGFGKLVAALNDGKPPVAAFQSAYGRTLTQVYADLQAYLKQNSLTGSALLAPPPAGDAVTSSVSDLDSGVMFADLLATMNKREQAKAAYDKLAAQYPGSAEIAESRGYLALQGGDNESARRYFEEALPGTKNPLMCYHLAMLDHDAGQSGENLIAALTRAVALKPDYAEARLQLGVQKFNRGDFAGAIAALAPIERIAPEHADTLHAVLAKAYAAVPDSPTAAAILDLPGGLKRVEGQADDLDCDGPHPRLSVLVGGATMIFEIADPKDVQLRHQGPGRFEFVCGTMQRFRVQVDYAPGATPKPGVAGTLKAIEF